MGEWFFVNFEFNMKFSEKISLYVYYNTHIVFFDLLSRFTGEQTQVMREDITHVVYQPLPVSAWYSIINLSDATRTRLVKERKLYT